MVVIGHIWVVFMLYFMRIFKLSYFLVQIPCKYDTSLKQICRISKVGMGVRTLKTFDEICLRSSISEIFKLFLNTTKIRLLGSKYDSNIGILSSWNNSENSCYLWNIYLRACDWSYMGRIYVVFNAYFQIVVFTSPNTMQI